MFICVRHGNNQRFLANTDCPVQLLLPYLRRKAGVPAGAVLDLCDPLGIPKLLFQAKLQSERASKFFPAPGTYYVCRVEFGAPGTQQEHAYQALVPLLKDPSPELTEALRQHCEHQHRIRLQTLRTLEGRRMPNAETAPATAQAPAAGKAAGRAGSAGAAEEDGAQRKAGGSSRAKREPAWKERHR
ncbi:uncharacterized protein CXorf65 homolog [Apteryx mantelli]|uniref:Uncharacterized protein CXorf65 homolog n=1 Tax=Apteryx mantelli TaxID=2696672 RepID=A0ABM4F6D5_9AVES